MIFNAFAENQPPISLIKKGKFPTKPLKIPYLCPITDAVSLHRLEH